MYETDEVLHDVGYGVLRCSFGKGRKGMGGFNILFPVPMRTLPTRLKTPVIP